MGPISPRFGVNQTRKNFFSETIKKILVYTFFFVTAATTCNLLGNPYFVTILFLI